MKTTLPTLLLVLFTTATSNAASLYTSGHGDLGIAYDGGAFELHHHLHAGAVVDGGALSDEAEYAPDELVISVSNPSLPRPADSSYGFTGVIAGAPIWTLPAVQDLDRPFYSIASEELDPSDFTGNLTLPLLGMSGPGDFSLWEEDGFGGANALFATSDGIDLADILSLTPGDHYHYNWSFTQPGLYELTFKVNGVHAIDGPVTDTATYTFQVAPEPSRALFAGLGFTALILRRRRQVAKL